MGGDPLSPPAAALALPSKLDTIMKREIHPTGERIYQAVKRQLLGGDFQPGERVDAAWLAQHHAASITPVRSALHRLAGERLVDARAGEGFHTLPVTEVGLRDLYGWNSHVLLLALQLSGQGAPEKSEWVVPAEGDNPQVLTQTERLFTNLAERSANEHCAAAVNSLNDQLRLARRLEALLFTDVSEEVTALADVFVRGEPADIRHGLTNYHRRRIRAAADIVRLAHRKHGGPR